MQYIRESAKTIPVIAEPDVLVVGSGPAGLAAAIAAAREGVNTMLVERFGCFGGVITQVGVESIAWYRYQGTVDLEGIGIEFERRAKARGGTQPYPYTQSEALHTDMFKVVADELVQEAGVRPLLHALAVGAVMDGNAITGIIIESKSGRQAILARQVIDATGDADIAHLAGAPVRKTPKEEMMGVSVVFSVSGINKSRFLEYVAANPATYRNWGEDWAMKTSGKEDDLLTPYLNKPFAQARKDGLLPANLTSIGGTWGKLTDAGEATNLNMIYMSGFDSTDVHDLTRAEMEGRRQALLAIEAMRAYVPGFENARLRNFGMTLGTRDSRKIIGQKTITGHDVKNQARFDDAIGIFPEFLDGYGTLILPTTGRYFQVPLGILQPQGVDNLLVAGRCVAGDKLSHTALRNMMCCTVTGQGAGVAAAVAVKTDRTGRDVDIRQVQRALQRQGVRID